MVSRLTRTVRLSPEVGDQLIALKRGKESIDAVIRRLLAERGAEAKA